MFIEFYIMYYLNRNNLNESELEDLISLINPKHSSYFILKEMLWEEKKKNKEYVDTFITAADYCDDVYEEEYATVVTEVDKTSGPWVYYHEQKIPNVDLEKRRHKNYGFVGNIPGLMSKKNYAHG